MAGDWLKIEVDLPDKPEVWEIAGILQIDPDAVVGKLLKVWRWFDAHTVDGNASGVTFALVDSKAGVIGFAEAMSLVGWLEQRDRTLSLPRFDRHNGKTAKNRALTAKRVASHKEKGNAKGNAGIVSDALPREEKRREEIEANNATHCLSPAAPETCPHQEIIAIYHEVLPMLPKVREWTPARQALLRSRWRESDKRQSLDWWRRYFAFVRDRCPFLVGKGEQPSNRSPFLADLEWLIRPSNMPKVIEGRYQDRTNGA